MKILLIYFKIINFVNITLFIYILKKEVTETPTTLIKTGPDITHIVDRTDEYKIIKRSV